MIEQVQVGGAVKGIGAIAGKKGGHTGKNGLFATLVALFAGQHNQNPKIKNQSGKTHRTADTVLQAAKTSVSAQHRKTQTITIDIEGAKKITGKNNKKSVVTVSDKKRPTHARHLKDQNSAVGLVVPAIFIQTSKTDIHTVEVRHKKLSGILQPKHTGVETTSRKHAQVAELSMMAQGHVRQASLHEQKAGAKEAGLKGPKEAGLKEQIGLQKVVHKSPGSPEFLVNNSLADQKPLIREGKNHIKQGAYPVPHVLSNPETTSIIKPETTAGKTALSASTASGLAADLPSELKAGNVSTETVRETNAIPNTLNAALHETGATRKHKGNKVTATNPSAIQTTVNEGAVFVSASQNVAAHARNIDGRPESSVRHNQVQHVDTLSRPLAHGLTPGDGQYGNPADQQTNQQGNQAGADSRFSGLVQADSSISRSNSQNTTPHRAFQHLRVVDAMNEIAHSAKSGLTRLDIQLEPAHLGKIHISLQTDAAKQLMVHIAAEQTVSQQAIQQNMPQLRHALEQQGLSLGQFSMSTGSQDSSGTGQQFNGRHEWSTMDGVSSGASSALVQTDTQTTSSGHGRLSIHV